MGTTTWKLTMTFCFYLFNIYIQWTSEHAFSLMSKENCIVEMGKVSVGAYIICRILLTPKRGRILQQIQDSCNISNTVKGRVQIKKKSREFSLTGGGGGLTPIPYLFYFLFCKIMYKRMLSDSDFWVLSEVQITLKYPTILWKIFNMNSLVPLFPWFQMSWVASINNANLTLGCWKKS